MNEHFQKFFSGIAPWSNVYAGAELTYIAAKGAEGRKGPATVLAARIRLLRSADVRQSSIAVDTEHLLAGRMPLDLGPADLQRLAQDRDLGTIRIRDDLVLQGHGINRQIGCTFDFHGHEYPRKPGDLLEPGILLEGAQIGPMLGERSIPTLLLDWELKANDQPYGSLNELIGALGLKFEYPSNGGASRLLIVAVSPANILTTSTFKNGTARVRIHADPALLLDSLHLGCQSVAPDGMTLERWRINSQHLKRQKGRTDSLMTLTIRAPAAASIYLYLTYGISPLHETVLSDRSRFPNARLAAYGTFDRDQSLLRTMFFETRKPGEHIERAATILFTLLGFSVLPVDGMLQSNDFPDLLAFTPNGNAFVIECTIGRIHNKDKSDKLKHRTVQVKDHMKLATLANYRPQSLILTTMPREEIASQIDDSRLEGIWVFCKEDIEEALQNLVLNPDPDVIFERITKKHDPLFWRS